jgi:NAD(P)-dependent dehydrogenase (short-subunit alcohol dehydrogenase family)
MRPIEASSDRLHVFALDVTHPQDVLAVVTRAWQVRGPIGVVVNNAGFGFLGAVEEVEAAHARQAFDTSFFGLAFRWSWRNGGRSMSSSFLRRLRRLARVSWAPLEGKAVWTHS